VADVNQLITLGIGTPSDITHFVLVGLSTEAPVGPDIPFMCATITSRSARAVITSRSARARISSREC